MSSASIKGGPTPQGPPPGADVHPQQEPLGRRLLARAAELPQSPMTPKAGGGLANGGDSQSVFDALAAEIGALDPSFPDNNQVSQRLKKIKEALSNGSLDAQQVKDLFLQCQRPQSTINFVGSLLQEPSPKVFGLFLEILGQLEPDVIREVLVYEFIDSDTKKRTACQRIAYIAERSKAGFIDKLLALLEEKEAHDTNLYLSMLKHINDIPRYHIEDNDPRFLKITFQILHHFSGEMGYIGQVHKLELPFNV